MTGGTVENERGQSPAQMYFRKRLQERANAAALSKTISSDNAIASPHNKAEAAKDSSPSTTEGTTFKPKKKPAIGIFTRAVANADSDSESDQSPTGVFKRKGTLFDDIFNIPISALNAVNTLLKNHVGR